MEAALVAVFTSKDRYKPCEKGRERNELTFFVRESGMLRKREAEKA